MKNKFYLILTVLIVMLVSSACNNEEDEAATELVMTEEVAAEEVAEEVEEVITEEESLEKRLQHFLNQYSTAWEEEDYGKMYDMWENSIVDTTTEDYKNNKAEFISRAEENSDEEPAFEINMDLVEILDESMSHNGETYIQMLVDLKMKATVDGEVMEEYEGLGHVYAMEFNSKYGFLIDDDMDLLEE